MSEPSSKAGASRFLVPVGILIFCALAFWFSTQFDRVPPILKRGIQPADFPQLVIGLIAILTLGIMLFERSTAPQKMHPVVWQSLLLMVGFILLCQVDLFLALGLFALLLSMLWGERRIGMLLLLGLVMPLMVFFLFDLVFEIRFPRGVLTSLWYN
jgi:hypothetical protein